VTTAEQKPRLLWRRDHALANGVPAPDDCELRTAYVRDPSNGALLLTLQVLTRSPDRLELLEVRAEKDAAHRLRAAALELDPVNAVTMTVLAVPFTVGLATILVGFVTLIGGLFQ
jgi:hypothetical protein